MGIDGWSFFERLPIQVKQSERVGRNYVDNFETAIERSGKHKGFLVAFSFTSGTVEEAARSKQTAHAVHLIKVVDLLRVADLIETAELAERPADLSGESPDLMALFGKVSRRSRQAWPPVPPTKRSAQERVAQVQAESEPRS